MPRFPKLTSTVAVIVSRKAACTTSQIARMVPIVRPAIHAHEALADAHEGPAGPINGVAHASRDPQRRTRCLPWGCCSGWSTRALDRGKKTVGIETDSKQ